MHPHLTMMLADQRAADMRRCAERSRRARTAPDGPSRHFEVRPALAPRLSRAHADLRAAR